MKLAIFGLIVAIAIFVWIAMDMRRIANAN